MNTKSNNSTATVTPDCESVKSNLLNQLNLLPKQTENEQKLDDVESSVVIGNDANESKINVQNVTQNNQTGNNITGTGHTINIYQCPPELINLLAKSINKNL